MADLPDEVALLLEESRQAAARAVEARSDAARLRRQAAQLLRWEGWSLSAIGKELGISKQRVEELLRSPSGDTG